MLAKFTKVGYKLGIGNDEHDGEHDMDLSGNRSQLVELIEQKRWERNQGESMDKVNKENDIKTMTVKEAYKSNEFINRIIADRPAKRVFEILGYCRTNKGYELRSEDDASYSIYLSGDKLVAIAEDY